MLSIRFPIPIKNALTPSIPRFSRNQTPRRIRSHPRLSNSLSLHCATATDAVVHREESREQLNDRFAPGVHFPPDDEPLPVGLRRELMPRHVAVIMDGNVRWERRRGLPAGSGHEAGAQSLRGLVELCCKWGIRVLTVFAFSFDNWTRPKVEVEFLLDLFEKMISSEIDDFASEGIRISIIGDSSKLPNPLPKLISDAEERTKDNSRLQLIVAVSYSGKYDVVQACKSISQKLAYTELFFASALWPDFGKSEFVEALVSFQQRQRRYGGRDL
ncbi:hypothetical protein ACFX19_029852 [Malus domestica]